jgi:hypothetical protein
MLLGPWQRREGRRRRGAWVDVTGAGG